MNLVTFLEGPLRDARHAFRMLRRYPAFSITALLTLALGIGATTAIFTVVNGVLIRPLPYPDPEALVSVWHSAVLQGSPIDNFNLSPQMFAIYEENHRAYQNFGIWRNGEATVTGAGDPEQVASLLVTHGVLPALGVPAMRGRWFSLQDDTPGMPETVILSHGYWQRRFGGDENILGRRITIDSRVREVVGVMPAEFSFLRSSSDVILPLRYNRSQPPSDFSDSGVARLKPGVTLAQANADLARMLPMWIDKYVRNPAVIEAMHLGPAVRPLKQDVVGDIGRMLWVLLGTVGMVLLIACANVANLMLVRAEGRQRELAVRAALGAGWTRIARDLIVESLTLAMLGGALGLALAYGGLRLLMALNPANLPRLAEISIDPMVLLFTFAASVVSGVFFGLMPVLKYAGPRVALALRGSGRGASQSRERYRSQNALVVIQVALALVLLVASGLMIRSFQEMRRVQPGFTQADRIQTVRISIPGAHVAEMEDVTRLQNGILEKISAIPGVASAAFVSGLPMEFPIRNNVVYAEGITAEDQVSPVRRMKFISPGLFQTMGTPLIAGRDITWADVYEKREVVLVSQNLARETWGSAQQALGKRIKTLAASPWREVIGVVGDVFDDGVHLRAPGIVYWPARQQTFVGNARSVAFAIRSERTGDERFLREIQAAVSSIDSGLPLSRVQSLAQIHRDSMARTSFTLAMLGIAGSIALLLGIVGIYGVLAYTVEQRRREVGIRLALGGHPGAVKRMFVRRGAVLSAVGIIIGMLAGAGLSRLMSTLLFGVTPLDPLTYGAAAAVLMLAAIAASYIPARQAAAVDPVETLRME